MFQEFALTVIMGTALSSGASCLDTMPESMCCTAPSDGVGDRADSIDDDSADPDSLKGIFHVEDPKHMKIVLELDGGVSSPIPDSESRSNDSNQFLIGDTFPLNPAPATAAEPTHAQRLSLSWGGGPLIHPSPQSVSPARSFGTPPLGTPQGGDLHHTSIPSQTSTNMNTYPYHATEFGGVPGANPPFTHHNSDPIPSHHAAYSHHAHQSSIDSIPHQPIFNNHHSTQSAQSAPRVSFHRKRDSASSAITLGSVTSAPAFPMHTGAQHGHYPPAPPAGPRSQPHSQPHSISPDPNTTEHINDSLPGGLPAPSIDRAHTVSPHSQVIHSNGSNPPGHPVPAIRAHRASTVPAHHIDMDPLLEVDEANTSGRSPGSEFTEDESIDEQQTITPRTFARNLFRQKSNRLWQPHEMDSNLQEMAAQLDHLKTSHKRATEITPHANGSAFAYPNEMSMGRAQTLRGYRHSHSPQHNGQHIQKQSSSPNVFYGQQHGAGHGGNGYVMNGLNAPNGYSNGPSTDQMDFILPPEESNWVDPTKQDSAESAISSTDYTEESDESEETDQR